MEDVTEAVRLEGGIVLGHDGSKCAQEALEWAARLAGRADMDLHVLRAWSMMSAPRPASWVPGYVPPLGDYEKAVHDELSAHVAAAGLDPAVRVTCHVVHASPAQGMIAAAAGADLLVVGARGRGGVAGLLVGSGRDQILHHAPRPVAVVPPAESKAKTSGGAVGH